MLCSRHCDQWLVSSLITCSVHDMEYINLKAVLELWIRTVSCIHSMRIQGMNDAEALKIVSCKNVCASRSENPYQPEEKGRGHKNRCSYILPVSTTKLAMDTKSWIFRESSKGACEARFWCPIYWLLQENLNTLLEKSSVKFSNMCHCTQESQSPNAVSQQRHDH